MYDGVGKYLTCYKLLKFLLLLCFEFIYVHMYPFIVQIKSLFQVSNHANGCPLTQIKIVSIPLSNSQATEVAHSWDLFCPGMEYGIFMVCIHCGLSPKRHP